MSKTRLVSKTYLDVFVGVAVVYVAFKLVLILLYGSWIDRSEFFNGGEYSPSLIDFIISEVVFNCVLIAILVGRFKLTYVLLCLVCSAVYFSRTFLILLMFASLFSDQFSVMKKISFLCFTAIGTYALLLLRHAGEFISLDEIFLYYLDYPVIGIGRLLVTNADGNSPFGFISLLFRPFGFISFMIDYFGEMNGSFSIERYASAILVNFVYIPLLQESYNAFGTILFPYVVSYGMYFGVVVFLMSIMFYYVSLRLIYSKSFALRVVAFLLITGILFSWSAPFIWVAPFLVRLLAVNVKMRKSFFFDRLYSPLGSWRN